jgi:hypothetical protein
MDLKERLRSISAAADRSPDACASRMLDMLPLVTTEVETTQLLLVYYLCSRDRIREIERSAAGFTNSGVPQTRHVLLCHPCPLPAHALEPVLRAVRRAFPCLQVSHSIDSFGYLSVVLEW